MSGIVAVLAPALVSFPDQIGTFLAFFGRGMFKRTPLACVVAAQEKKSVAFIKSYLSTCPKNRAERVEYTVNLLKGFIEYRK